MTTVSWINSSGGNWSNSADWSDGAVPPSSDDVAINAGGSGYTVDVDGADAANSLSVVSAATVQINGGQSLALATGTGTGANSGTIDIGNGAVLSVAGGTFDNAGQIFVQGYNTATEFLVAGTSVTLTGGGSLTLDDAGTQSQIIGAAATDKLVNVSNTISGAGLIGNGTMSLDNQASGVIDATNGDRLIIDTAGGTFTNEGLLEATGGSGLQISGATSLTNTGTILASGSFVDLDGITVTGGKLASANGYAVAVEGGYTTKFTGVTVTAASTLEINNGAFGDISATMTNDGTVVVHGYNTATQLIVDAASATLTGKGIVELVDSGSGSQIVGAAATDKLVNVNNTIDGAGLLGNATMSLDNQAAGVIDASGGNKMVIDTAGGTFTNEGLLEATSGNGLQITGGMSLTNTGTILAGGSFVYLDGVTVAGGTLQSTVGEVQVEGGYTSTLNGITIAASSTFQVDNGAVANLTGTITNKGTLVVEGYNTAAMLVVDATTVSLTGAGSIEIIDAGTYSQFVAAAATDTLVNVNNTIFGAGLLGNASMSIDNQAAGVIDATGGNRLVINTSGGSFSNEGLLEATGGNGLQIAAGTTLTNTGTILANGAYVFLDSVTVTGGKLATANGSEIQSEYANVDTFANVTLTAGSTLQIDNGSAIDFTGTLTNQGTVFVQGYNTTAQFIVDSATLTLTGGGTVTLIDAGSQSQIIGAAVADTLVNVNNTIDGAGLIGNGTMSLDNQAAGVIDATGGNRMVVDLAGGSFTNEGLLEATGGNGLQISGGTSLTNTGTILANGANVYLDTVSLTGGTLTGVGNEFHVEGGNTSALAGATLTTGSTLQVDNDASLELTGTLFNNGTVVVDGYNTATALIVAGPTVTLVGGSVQLVDAGSASQIIGASTADLMVNVSSVISGAGLFDNGTMNIDNRVGGTIEANSGDALTIDAAYVINTATLYETFSNEGVLASVNPGTGGVGGLTIVGTVVNNTGNGNSGQIEATGTNTHINLLSGTTIQGGTLETASNGVIQVVGGYAATLDGTAAPITLSGSLNVGNAGSLSILTGLTNDGIIVVNGYNTATQLIAASATVTLTGAGQIQLIDAGTQSQIAAAAAGDELVNVNNTIFGAGVIGVGGLAFDNEAAGVIDATGGSRLDISTAGESFTNEGLMEATGGQGLDFTAGTAISNTGSIVAAGATVFIDDATITGGTLTAAAGQLFDIEGNNDSTLSGVTLSAASAFDVTNAATLSLLGTFDNAGTVSVQGYNTATQVLAAGASVTLTGGGTIILADAGTQSQIGATAAGDALANVNNTIEGGGVIGGGVVLDNQAAGVIDADNGSRLQLNLGGEGFTNEGLIEATAGAGLQISAGTTIVNTGTISANGATVFLDGGAVVGGTLAGPTSSFVVEGGNTATLSGVTITAGTQVNVDNAASLDIAGNVVNNGTITLGGYNTPTQLIADAATATLSGNGIVQLVNAGTQSQILGAAPGDKLVNNGNTIEGTGLLGAGAMVLDNRSGVIDSNGGGTLVIDTGLGALTNEGTIEDTAGSGLVIQNATLTNTGTIESLDNAVLTIAASTVITNLSGTTLTGGTWEANVTTAGHTSTLDIASGGPIVTDAANIVLSGAGSEIVVGGTTLETSLTTIAAGGALRVLGGRGYATTNKMTDNGVIQVNGGVFSSAGTLGVGSTGTILGDGRISPAVSGSGLLEASGGGTLTFAGAVTGSFSLEAVGTVLSINAAAIATDTTSITLSGAGSDIRWGTTTFTTIETSLTTIAAGGSFSVLGARGYTTANALTDNGSLVLAGGTFTAASLSVSAGGSISGSGTLANDVANAGSIVASGGTLVLAGGVTGSGALQAAVGGTLEFVVAQSVAAVTANGTVELNGVTLSPASLSVAAGGRLLGFGSVSGVAVANAGTIEAKGGDLVLAGGATGSGTLQIDAASTLELKAATAAGTVSDSGVLQLDGVTLTVGTTTISSTGVIDGTGTLAGAVTDTGAIDSNAGLLVVSGAVSGAGRLEADAGATLDLSGYAALPTIASSFTLNGVGSVIESGSGAGIKTLDSQLTTIAATGTLAVLGGRGFADAKALTDSGSLTLNGGTLSATSLTLGAAGKLIGFGTVANAVGGAGTIESLGGLLKLAAGATGTSAMLVEAASTLELASASSAHAVTIAGTLQLDGITLTPSAVTLEKGSRLIGSGTVTSAVSDAGTIEASSGLLKLAGAVAGSGVLQIDAGATLELGAAVAATDTAGFAAATGTLQLDAPGSFAGTIAGFTGSDVINLGGAVATGLSYSTTTKKLTVTGASGTIAVLKFSGNYTQASFTLNPSGTEILEPPAELTAQTIGAAAPSFLATPEAPTAPGISPAGWTAQGDVGAAGLDLAPLPAAAMWPDSLGGASDPSAAYGGTGLLLFGEAHAAPLAPTFHAHGGS